MIRNGRRTALSWTALLVVAALAVAGGCSRSAVGVPAPLPGYAPQLQCLLEAKLARLRELAQHPAIREAANAANRVRATLSEEEIARLDAQWRQAAPNDDFGRDLLTNAAARLLVEFRERHRVFSEVFLTDRYGLVVAMTNRTSDFAQADEDWWQRACAGGQGHAGAGEIEYDASSHTQAIALYVPVPAVPGGPPVGVIKALYDVDAIKAEL